jgi:hypothetical protein
MNPTVNRPSQVEQLGQTLEHLVTYGGARVPDGWQAFLRRVGIAGFADDKVWMWPTQHFLRDALPARDSADLMRRALIRDPLYRLHLDLCLLSVIHTVAIAERWNRFEEILFNACLPVAPRLMQLLDWQMAKSEKLARELTPESWRRITEACDGVHAEPFAEWDRQLWGKYRGFADLFPLLLDLYVPLTLQPVHISFVEGESGSLERAILTSLVLTAREGEGLTFAASEVRRLTYLQDAGVPLRTMLLSEERVLAYLVGRVSSESDSFELNDELADVPLGLPVTAKGSYLVSKVDQNVRTLWSIREPTPMLAVVSIPCEMSSWPIESSEHSPKWLQLPGSEVLATAGARKSDSRDSDKALSQVANHPLYGFLLQLLLLEALDRELGEETVTLALPQNRKLEGLNDWAETRVLYRLREQKEELAEQQSRGFLVLGTLDEIVGRIAHEVGIVGVAEPYRTTAGPWSRALALMNTAGLVDGRPDGWILTITNYILDRLHGGTLMKEVIRGGRTVREKMHGVLTTLWQEQAKLRAKERVLA